jgi:2-oxoglutarate dehydrogenase E2 component (dihydrolipoamide succinyltransferase)
MVEVTMPQMGISVSEGTILEWRKAEGDEVAADETLCDVTTDKVDVEIPCPAAGTLARIVAEQGQTLLVGEVIAEIDTGGGSAANGASDPISETDAPAPAKTPAGETGEPRAGFISPIVRRMAAEHDVDLDQVEGHGIGGRIRKADLAAHIEAGATNGAKRTHTDRPLHSDSPYRPEPEAEQAPKPPPATPRTADSTPSGGRREPMSPMRRSIAEHMVRSIQTAAHCTTIVEVDFSAVARRRAELKETYARKGLPLTYLAFVARAVVESLGEFPALNASVDGEDLVLHEDVNLGIAVSLDRDGASDGGLIVPVIQQAQRLSLEGTAAAIADLAARARERKLDPDEVQGGTFTITNPGQFGAVLATPIINQPQVAILDLEAIVKRAVVVEGPEGDSIAVRPMGFLPMSWDHRALDGAEAARFLGSVKGRLEAGEIR